MPPPTKRSALSIEKKLEILKEVDKNRLRKTEIAKLFDIPKSTLFTIIKNRQTIATASGSGVSLNRIRARDGKYPMLEKILIEWLKNVRSANMPIDGTMMTEKAQTVAAKLNIAENFKASSGWLQNFKLRHGLSFKNLHGESGSVNIATVIGWKEGKIKELLAEYDANDIFNADETALFFKTLPDKTLAFKNERCNGVKRAKQRITILLAANMSGSEKLPILVIGNAQKPRCFKGVKSFPASYKANKKAWMTANIFEEWVRDLDKKMENNGRKILLIIDNCTAHPEIRNLKAIKIEFLPPNVTSMLQPLDQGVVHSFKKHYQKMLVKRVVIGIENNKPYVIDILAAIHLAHAAWQEVSQQTIASCFRHAGFMKEESETSSSTGFGEQLTEDNVAAMKSVGESKSDEFMQMFSAEEEINFDAYASVDVNMECSEELTEEELINRTIRHAETEQISDNTSSEDEQEDAMDAPPRPTIKQAYEAFQVIRDFLQGEENAQDCLSMVTALENKVLKVAVQHLKQSTITKFFK